MFQEVEKIIEDILKHYESSDDRERLLRAKDQYFDLTGMLNEEDDEYESRMNCFNEWFIFEHELTSGERVIEKWLSKNKISEVLSNALLNVEHSLFEFAKISFKKQVILKDILNDVKVTLTKDHPYLGVVQDDLFLSRVINIEDSTYMLKGVRMLPQEVRSILKKQSKKVRKLGEKKAKTEFLVSLEALKTKSLRYSHLEPAKIFTF